MIYNTDLMKLHRVLIIGSGQRVQTAILPAIRCSQPSLSLVGIYSRVKKNIKDPISEKKFETITDLNEINFTTLDLIIVAITIENVPEVLALLSQRDVKHIILFLDTPVLRYNHLWATKYFANFRKVFVSEDFIALANLILIKNLINKGAIGTPRRAYFFHSGYRHHALAALKYIFSSRYFSKI